MDTTIYRKPNVIEITLGPNFCYKISQYHEDYTLIISLLFLTLYISLPNFGYDFNKWDRSWGISYHDNAFWVNWGENAKCFRMPWDWEHVRHEVMFPDGSLRKPVGDSWDTTDGRLIESHPYHYKLKSGEIQERKATIYVEEMEWRWRWLKRLPYPRNIQRCISVEFDGEVGERTGSWKGGTIGCGYKMLPGESPLKTLRRMERERKFD